MGQPARQSQRVARADVEALLRLTHELHDLPPDPQLRVSHFMETLRQLLDARLVVMEDVLNFGAPSDQMRWLWLDVAGWINPVGKKRYGELTQLEYARRWGPFYTAMHKRGPRTGTRSRAEEVPDKEWYRSEYFNEFARVAEMDDVIATVLPAGWKNRTIGIGVHRPVDGKRFTKREKTIFEIVASTFGWFARSIAVPEWDLHPRWRHAEKGKDLEGHPGSRIGLLTAGLPMRDRQTLLSLLRGKSEKEIAVAMQISQQTVHDYVKRLHRRFGVSSRGELLSLFIGRVMPEGESPGLSKPAASGEVT